MAKRPKQTQRKSSEEREPEIIAAAGDAFRRKGYANVSIQEIADSVGLLKGSIYYYIDSKEDLLFAVISELDGRALKIAEEIYESDAPAIERLAKLIEAQTRLNIANVDTLAVFYHDFGELSDARREPIIQERKRYETLIVKMIQEAQRDGDVSADLDPKLASYFILGAVNWLYTWYDPEGPVGVEELAQLFRSLVMVGFAPARLDLAGPTPLLQEPPTKE